MAFSQVDQAINNIVKPVAQPLQVIAVPIVATQVVMMQMPPQSVQSVIVSPRV